MAKNFAPRVSKRNRKTVDISKYVKEDIFKSSDDKLLKGAKLDEIKLKDVIVRDQVRTKFNDSSIKELADNIQSNGLIQPLVLHRTGSKYTLICGERRFRAMSSISIEEAPCFVLEGKNEEELMAIQFSENSSREALHYIDKADGILNYQRATKASERKITAALGISKSEVHRSLIISKLPKRIKESAKKYDIEKYVLVEYSAIEDKLFKSKVATLINKGQLLKRSQLQKLKREMNSLNKGKKSAKPVRAKKSTSKAKKVKIPENISSELLLKALNSKGKKNIDKKTKDLLKDLLEQALN